MARSQQQPLIYFHSLELENVRCFGERQMLELTDITGKSLRPATPRRTGTWRVS